MVGGFRYSRGFDPKQLELEEAKIREEKIAEYRRNMARGMVRFANEALARGDIHQYAEINFGLMAQMDPVVATLHAHAMLLEYLTGLPYYQNLCQNQTGEKK